MKKKLVSAAIGLILLTGFSLSGFAQWNKATWSITNSYNDLYVKGDNLIARTWDTLNGGRAYLTVDNGVSWTEIATDSSEYILSLVILDNEILAGTWNGLIRTDVGSADWTELTSEGIPADTTIWSLAELNEVVYAGGVGTIYKSSDSGDTWTEINSGIPGNARVTAFETTGDTVFAGTDTDGVFMSTDSGSNWTAVNTGLTDLNVSQLVNLGSSLYVLTVTDGAFISNDNGESWAKIGLPNINCMIAADNKLYVGTDYSGIYVTSGFDEGWSSVNTGMADNTRIFSLGAGRQFLIAGTSDGIWGALYTSVKTPVEGNQTPEEYVLGRNYPNPFNPTTTIGFSIPVTEHVKISIYNINGQKIRTLLDTSMTKGTHNVVWDGLSDDGIRPPSGVYLYELRTGSFREAKKLMLMK